MASLMFQVVMMGISYLMQPKPPTLYGPRLSDLKAQTSSYGTPIPKTFGAVRIAGNVIWSTDIIETTTTTEQGGKGDTSQTTVNYNYAQSFAVALGEGPIYGIRKIWANNKIIYNKSDTADAASNIISNATAAGFRIYTGSSTQTADSLIQANIGAANTPAYRGTAYIVFENLQLADYYNSTPTMEFEVVTEGYEGQALVPLSTIDSNTVAAYGMDIADNYAYITDYTSGTLGVFSVASYTYTGIPGFIWSDPPPAPDTTNIIYLGKSVSTTSGIGSIKAVGTIVYTVDNNTSGSLRVFDASDPNYPVLSKSIVIGNGQKYVDATTSAVFVTCSGDNTLTIASYIGGGSFFSEGSYTLSSGELTITSTIGTSSSPKAVKVVGTYAYVITTQYLEIFSIADIHVPAFVGRASIEPTIELYIDGKRGILNQAKGFLAFYLSQQNQKK